VPLQAEHRVGLGHADAIVEHAQPRDAATLDLDAAAGRSGVHRVLEQLFERAGRALDDLAGRDLTGELIG
jgi:hypothetical protein